MIGVLNTPLYPEKNTPASELVGSQLGATEFLKAMAKYLPSTLYLGEESEMVAVQRDLTRLIENEGLNPDKVATCGLQYLPVFLSKQPLMALHNVRGPFLHELASIRALFSPSVLPLTCLVHGFSYQSALWDFFIRLTMTPLLPCDSIICTSHVAKQAFNNTLTQVHHKLSFVTGNVLPEIPRVDVIPLGVNTELFRPREKADARQMLGLPKNKILLLYFGRIDAALKGDLRPLLLVFARLLQKHGEKIVLVLAGNSTEENVSNLLQTASQLGCAQHLLVRSCPSLAEGPLYYSAADIFVSPTETLQESFGLSPLEAMASGLPVVVSDWDGYRETVVHERTGFRIKTYWANCLEPMARFAPLYSRTQEHFYLGQSVAVDTDELFQYLDILISHPEKRQEMGQAAREHVLANYTWQSVMQQAYALWQELAAIAATIPHTKTLIPSALQPDYFRAFGHFATQTLEGTTRLDITEQGQHACRGSSSFPVYPGMQYWLETSVLRVMLRFIKSVRFFRQQATVDDIVTNISKKYGIEPGRVLLHILWLLKYGYIRVG